MTEVVAIVDTQEEEDFFKLKRIGQRRGFPVCEHFLTLEVFADQNKEDKNREALFRRESRGHTWVRNTYNAIHSRMSAILSDDGPNWGLGYYDQKDYAGNVWNTSGECSNTVNGRGILGSAGNVAQGIVVGSSALAWSFNHWALDARIASGTGIGQLNYWESEPFVTAAVGLTLTVTILRFINNNSGVLDTVHEVAIYENVWYAFGSRYIMLTRDLTGGTVVPDMGQLAVTYTVALTWPF